MNFPPKPDHSVARWAGVTAFATNLAAVNIVALLGDALEYKIIASFITAVFVGLSVYGRERLLDAKRERGDKVQ